MPDVVVSAVAGSVVVSHVGNVSVVAVGAVVSAVLEDPSPGAGSSSTQHDGTDGHNRHCRRVRQSRRSLQPRETNRTSPAATVAPADVHRPASANPRVRTTQQHGP